MTLSLHDQAASGDAEAIGRSLAHGSADERSADERSAFGATPLMIAARNGHINVVRLLISHGADPLASDFEGFNALHAAAKGGRPEVVGFLLDLGVPVETRSDRGYTALNIAVVRADVDRIVETIAPLLAAGADINTRAKRGTTPLTAAAIRNAASAVAGLVESGADINAQDDRGFTALMLVAAVGFHPDMAQRLLHLGADPDLRNIKGQTALMLAERNASMLTALLDGRVSGNLADGDGGAHEIGGAHLMRAASELLRRPAPAADSEDASVSPRPT